MLIPPTGSSFPWKHIWQNKAPSRVAWFVEMVALRKILTIEKETYHSSGLVSCEQNGESIAHLLLRYELVRDIWVAVFITLVLS